MDGCEFRVLGGTTVFHDGDVLSIPAGKQRSLLACLLINRGDVIPSDRLLETVWADAPPASGLNALQFHISKLRRSLGPCGDAIVFRNSGYVLDVPAEAVDSFRFERLLAQARAVVSTDPDRAAQLTAQGLDLWRGAALADCAYEEFAQAEVRRLEELRLAALELYNDAELAAGRVEGLVPDLEAQVTDYPLHEALWSQLMYALYRTARQPEALRAYKRALEVFGDLGTVPSEDLAHLEELILLRDPSLDEGWPLVPSGTPGEAPVALPTERTPFVGRDDELRLGTELLASVPLLTVVGPPGVGKTRLARKLAAMNTVRYPHGVFFVPLAPVDDASLVEPAIAGVLGVRGGSERSTRESLAAYLSERKLLLVLDNLEQITGIDSVVSRLLDGAPSATVLATSRIRLGIRGEQELPLGPLGLPEVGERLDPAGLERHEAVALFASRARAADPRFRLASDNAEDVAGIVRSLDGVPLAIELAAARIKMLGLAAMRGRLGEQLDLLTGGPSDAPDHHQTLRSAIAWSYDLLETDERRFFRCLGVFRGFTLDAAVAVTQLPEADVFAAAASLFDKSLLYRIERGDGSRFALLEALREFARRELESVGELDAHAQAHADYFAELVEEMGPLLTTKRQNDALAVLAPEVDNIREALRFAVETQQPDVGLRIAERAWRLWESLGLAEEGKQWISDLLSLPGVPPAMRASGLSALGGLLYWQADYPGAWQAYQEALELYRDLEARAQSVYTLFAMSMTATWDGNGELGEELADEALALLGGDSAEREDGFILMAKAWAIQRRGRFEEARPMWDTALSRARESGDEHLVITQLVGIAVNDHHTGDEQSAMRTAMEALDRAHAIRNLQLTIWALDVVASLAATSVPEHALRLATTVQSVRRAIGGGMAVEPLEIESAAVVARDMVGAHEAQEAIQDGESMDWEQAYEYARDVMRMAGAGSGEGD